MKKSIVILAAAAMLLLPAGMHADTIVLDSGKSVTGDIIEETPEEIVVKLSSGVTTRINRDEIVEIRRTQELEKEYDKRRKEIKPGDTQAMMELAGWCRRRGLKKQQREVLQAILRFDPDNAYAKRELGMLDGKLPGSARKEKADPGDIIFVQGKGSNKDRKENPKSLPKNKHKTSKVWGDKKSGKKAGKSRPSKFKPKGTTRAGLKGLDWLLQHGAGRRVVTTAFVGLACLASKDNRYAQLLNRCISSVKNGLKRHLTGKRQPKASSPTWGNMCNWKLSIGGMFLAEAYPYFKSEELKAFLQQVCDQLIINMEGSGGWGHHTAGPCPDGYIELEVVSNFALAFLGMCKQQGVSVPRAKLQKAVAYIEQCVNSRGVAYNHMEKYRGTENVSRSGGAIFALAMAGAKKGKYAGLCAVLDRKMNNMLKKAHSMPAFAFLGCAIGSLQASRSVWDKYVQTWFKTILEHQEKDGSFKRIVVEGRKYDKDQGPEFLTAIYSFLLLVDRANLKFSSGCARGR